MEAHAILNYLVGYAFSGLVTAGVLALLARVGIFPALYIMSNPSEGTDEEF